MKTSYAGQSIKNQTSKRMWCGIANSPTKSREYCLKEGDAMEFGEFKDTIASKAKGRAAGAKAGNAASTKQWHDLKDDINGGMTEKEVLTKYPHLYFKHSSGISRGITVANAVKRRTEKTCVHVYTGRPGCGKTSSAIEYMETQQGEHFEYSSPNKIWWTGYDGTQPVLFDDFHGNYPFDEFKKLTDKYPHKVPVHNGMINFNASLLVITSNSEPSHWWKEEVVGIHGLAALYRRINVLQHWDDEKECFVPTPVTSAPMRELWSEGCVCDPKYKLTSSGTLILPDADLSDSQDPSDDGEVIPSIPLSLPETNPDSSLKRTFPPIPNPPRS